MSSVTVQAPAKINLSLGVGAPRPDGFHALATVYQAVGVFDELVVTPAEDGCVALEVDAASPRVDVATVPTDETNLAVRAARLLARHAGVDHGAHLRLSKQIPVAGGLAGGSADAAAALVGCDALWGTGASAHDLLRVAAELGSDVPFAVLGGTAVGSGRGEAVQPLMVEGGYHWVLACSARGLSTATVYAEVDRLRGTDDVPEPSVPDALVDALRAGDPKALGRALDNDLQAAALSLRPELADLLALGRACGAIGCLVSGSGPTCLFLANDAAHALDISVGLASAGDSPEVLHAVGPVPGARVVSR